MGTASFMRKMDVRLPGDINLKTGLFLFVDRCRARWPSMVSRRPPSSLGASTVKWKSGGAFWIIDTLQRIRGQALPRESGYAQDYREMETLKGFMDKRGVSVLFVHQPHPAR